MGSIVVWNVTVLNMVNLTSGVKPMMGKQNTAVGELIRSLLLTTRTASQTVHATTMVMSIFGATPKRVIGNIAVPDNSVLVMSQTGS